jgi:hypothetical protein
VGKTRWAGKEFRSARAFGTCMFLLLVLSKLVHSSFVVPTRCRDAFLAGKRVFFDFFLIQIIYIQAGTAYDNQ